MKIWDSVYVSLDADDKKLKIENFSAGIKQTSTKKADEFENSFEIKQTGSE